MNSLRRTYRIFSDKAYSKKKLVGSRTIDKYPLFELGWLDRIGYKEYKKGILNHDFTIESRMDAMGADHLPVIMKCRLNPRGRSGGKSKKTVSELRKRFEK